MQTLHPSSRSSSEARPTPPSSSGTSKRSTTSSTSTSIVATSSLPSRRSSLTLRRQRGVPNHHWAPWRYDDATEPTTIVTWNARALMCYKGKRRRRKQAALNKFMKRKCAITLQEVHGSEALLRTWVDTQPYP
eukprot:5808410-Pyramimonas_sp.AAC.1